MTRVDRRWRRGWGLRSPCRPLAVAVAVATAMLGTPARAQSEGTGIELSGPEVARRTNARDDGNQVSRTFVMELISKRGKTRRRATRVFRRDFGEERRSILFFEDPPGLEGTALLTFDYPEAGRSDDQWIYLPALRKSRRVAIADRGRSFLGTDLSFEDIKKGTKLGIDDYRWNLVGTSVVDGFKCWHLEGLPVNEGTADALGYSRALFFIDATIWMPRRADYWNRAGTPLKTIALRDIREVEGVWTAHRIEAENLKTGHRTRLLFGEVDYHTALPDELFSEPALSRGAP